jgi:hypothetical protein
VTEPGLDLHEWETRWAELQELAAETPDETLPEIVRLVGEMLVERGYDLENPVVKEGEEAEIIGSFQAAREIARAAETEPLERDDLDAALEDLTEIHDYMVEGRTPP